MSCHYGTTVHLYKWSVFGIPIMRIPQSIRDTFDNISIWYTYFTWLNRHWHHDIRVLLNPFESMSCNYLCVPYCQINCSWKDSYKSTQNMTLFVKHIVINVISSTNVICTETIDKHITIHHDQPADVWRKCCFDYMPKIMFSQVNQVTQLNRGRSISL